MKRPLILLLVLCTLLLPCATGCLNPSEPRTRLYYDAFDTVCTLYAYAEEDAVRFATHADAVGARLTELHRMLDIYREYDGTVNLATVNRLAPAGPVEVSEELFSFLVYAKQLHRLTDGQVNVAMGAVLTLWHDARTAAQEGAEARLPDAQALTEAAAHTDIDDLILDAQTRTVAFADPLLRLNVGALGKGYAADCIVRELSEQGVSSYVIDLGGALHAIGKHTDGRPFTAAIRSPEGDGYLGTVTLTEGACVTSGSYERYMTVGGVRYHHVIDPDTLYPATHFTSVSVLGESSLLCDALSTALFCMTYEEACATLDRIGGLRAVLVEPDGTVHSYGGALQP